VILQKKVTNCNFHINTVHFLGLLHPPIHWVLGALSPGVKWPGREADHSPPCSAKVENSWSYTSTPPVRLHGVVLN